MKNFIREFNAAKESVSGEENTSSATSKDQEKNLELDLVDQYAYQKVKTIIRYEAQTNRSGEQELKDYLKEFPIPIPNPLVFWNDNRISRPSLLQVSEL